MATFDTFFRINRRNKLTKRIVECYKRPNIPCGFICCGDGRLDKATYFILNADVLMKFKTLLLSDSVIILHSVLKQIRLVDFSRYNSYKRLIKQRNIFIFYDDFRLDDVKSNISEKSLLNDDEIEIVSMQWNDTTDRAYSFYTMHIKNVNFILLNEKNLSEHADDPTIKDFILLQENDCGDANYPVYTNDGLVGFFHTSYYNCFSGCIHSMNKKYYVSNRLHANRALDGDEVYFKIVESSKIEAEVVETEQDITADMITHTVKTEDTKHQYACITGIKSRKDKIIVGTILKSTVSGENAQTVLVKPIDKRYPPCRIQTKQVKFLMDSRIKLIICDWHETSKYPNATYFGRIGAMGVLETEIDSILISNEIMKDPLRIDSSVSASTDCAHELINRNEATNPTLFKEFNANRLDLRDELVFSIDPPGCTDIDDALHCKIGETIEVGVHIADVSTYVARNTVVDNEAKRRGTTVYLNDRRIDMLPDVLSSDLCSLKSDVDRFALSLIFHFDHCFNIVDSQIRETVIRSKRSFTYEEAQNVLNDRSHMFHAPINQLNLIAKKLKAERVSNGALTFNSEEILVDKNNKGFELKNKKYYETCSLIEEFMILANITVASFMYNNIKSYSLLRRHPEVEIQEVDCDIESIKSMLRIRSMAQATYFSSGTMTFSDFRHFGLAIPIYTHFTSPIRRYADLVVHRLIKSILYHVDYGYDNVSIDIISQALNKRHRSAKMASRECNLLFLYLYLRDREPVTKSYVVKSLANGSIVYIPEYDIDGFIRSKFPLFHEVKVRIIRDDDQFFVNRWITLSEVNV